MDHAAVSIYVVCDEVLTLLGVEDDPQSRMSNAEVAAFTILASQEFAGNHRRARWMCRRLGYFPRILSPSRLNRRIHQLPWQVWTALFRILANSHVDHGEITAFAVDSFPVPCCKRSRHDRRRLFRDREYLGYAASEKRYYCGLRVHMVVTCKGAPVELSIRPARHGDLRVLKEMTLELPSDSLLYADGAYTSFELEDLLMEGEQIKLMVKRKHRNSSRARTPAEERHIGSSRQIVETAFSCITNMLPRCLRARTDQGFKIRLMGAILAYSLGHLGS